MKAHRIRDVIIKRKLLNGSYFASDVSQFVQAKIRIIFAVLNLVRPHNAKVGKKGAKYCLQPCKRKLQTGRTGLMKRDGRAEKTDMGKGAIE